MTNQVLHVTTERKFSLMDTKDMQVLSLACTGDRKNEQPTKGWWLQLFLPDIIPPRKVQQWGLLTVLPRTSPGRTVSASGAKQWKENEQIFEVEAVLAAPPLLGGKAVCQPSGRKNVYLGLCDSHSFSTVTIILWVTLGSVKFFCLHRMNTAYAGTGPSPSVE